MFCNLLRDHIRGYDKIFTKDDFYSKSLLFVQSSGTGRPRLADAYGKLCPMVTYVLRNENYGFPPADRKIVNAMCKNPSYSVSSQLDAPNSLEDRNERATNIWFHAISVGILKGDI